MIKTYDLTFLKEKELFKKEQTLKEKLPSQKQVTCVFDPDNRIAYFEDIERNKIRGVVKHLKERFNFDYYWFWEEGRLIVFRTFGENKQFIFNIEQAKERRKTEYLKSKIKKLRDFSIDNPNILFDVKDVVDHFYKMLWIIRIKIAKAIQDDISDNEKIFSAQRIIDRLIFTYFLVEKGIIKGKDKRGREVLPDVKELFKYLLETSRDFHKLINKIFFDFLNNEVNNEMPIPEREEFSLIIPYLNGGLFREKILKTKIGKTLGESNLIIKGFNWEELINELNEYNWIIEEFLAKEDEDIIGNLTPEILGHIYEKFVITLFKIGEINLDELETTKKGELKAGRKKIGGYYTPDDITKYLSEKTIFPYIKEKMRLDDKLVSFEEFYEKFRNNIEILKEFDKHLSEIKILDPAVGSGHFLMSAAELLYDWSKKCGTELNDYSLRYNIIIHNLYGVDIMEGAVEICKLRLWLWLIASLSPASVPDALPNIDFNIREGNSLIGFSEERVMIGKQLTFITQGVSNSIKEYKQKIKIYKRKTKNAEESVKELNELHDKIQAELDKNYLNYLHAHAAFLKKSVLPKDLKMLKCFHWIMEFPNVFNDNQKESKRGFDIILGNPPYGDILSAKEKALVSTYKTGDLPEISAYFVERQIQLLNKQGHFGNILILRIMYDSRFNPLRQLLRDNFEISRIICFERRPSQVFKDAQIQVGVLVSNRGNYLAGNGTIKSSKFIRLKKEERNNLYAVMKNVDFYNIEGFVLGDRIGYASDKYEILPKIGTEMMASTINKLKISSLRTINDAVYDDGEYILYRRRGGGYHPTCMLETLYDSTGLKPIKFKKEIERNLSFLIINSHIFYLFWMVYSNARNLDTGLIKKFPLPNLYKIEEKEEQIRNLTNNLWEQMIDVFDDSNNYVYMTLLRPLLEEVVDLLANFYDLNDEQVSFIKEYDSKYIW